MVSLRKSKKKNNNNNSLTDNAYLELICIVWSELLFADGWTHFNVVFNLSVRRTLLSIIVDSESLILSPAPAD